MAITPRGVWEMKVTQMWMDMRGAWKTIPVPSLYGGGSGGGGGASFLPFSPHHPIHLLPITSSSHAGDWVKRTYTYKDAISRAGLIILFSCSPRHEDLAPGVSLWMSTLSARRQQSEKAYRHNYSLRHNYNLSTYTREHIGEHAFPKGLEVLGTPKKK